MPKENTKLGEMETRQAGKNWNTKLLFNSFREVRGDAKSMKHERKTVKLEMKNSVEEWKSKTEILRVKQN